MRQRRLEFGVERYDRARPADSGPGGAPGEGPRLRHFSQSLPMLLLRGRESVMRYFRASLRSFDLTEQQWRVLRALDTVEEIEVSDLARATYLLAPSLSRILRDLEKRGIIARRNDAADLRRGLIRMAPPGRALIEAVSPHSQQIYARITRSFGPQKLHDLEGLLRELEAAMAAEGLPDTDAPDEP